MVQPVAGVSWQAAVREEAGFAAMVRLHQSMVYSIAWHFFRNRALAEEVAQDVFLQLYRSLDSIDSESHLEPWLRRTTSNRCIDFWRKKGRKEEIPLDGLPEPVSQPGAPDPFRSERLRKMVASLPEKQRMVIILRYGEDLDADEIASALGMPVRTVWSHLRRAVALLREKAVHFFGEEA
jgi:RNA polymerase sigma-70 factor (ECF subfamily)